MTRKSGPVCVSVINTRRCVGKTAIVALLARYISRAIGLNSLAADLDWQ